MLVEMGSLLSCILSKSWSVPGRWEEGWEVGWLFIEEGRNSEYEIQRWQ